MSQEERGILGALREAARSPVPRALRPELTFLWLALALFAIQVVTGILLSLYYQTSPAAVEASVAFIMRDVSWGWLIRGLHHWTAQGLIVLIAIEIVRVFIIGDYRRHRAWTWYATVLLFWLASVTTFSGDLLTWDGEAYWRVTQLLSGLEAVPLVGGFLAEVVRGGGEVSSTTLARTYTAHGLFLPWLIWLVLLVNLWFLARRAKTLVGGKA